MIFSVSQKELIKTLEEVYKSIDNLNYFLPIRNFCIESKDDLLTITGTNGKLSIRKSLSPKNEVEIYKETKLLIPSTLFLNIIKKCSGKILFDLKEEKILVIKNNDDNYEINLVNSEDYPILDFDLYGTKINVNLLKLKKAIDNVIFASSQKDEDFILSGVNIKLKDNKLIISATDSFRLAQEIIEINDDRNLSFDITVLNKNLKNFIPHNVEDKEVEFYANEHKINLIYQGFNIQSTIIDAVYKDISNLFNKTYDKTLLIDKNVLNNAISKAIVITAETYNKIRLEISQSEIVLSSMNNEVGNTKVVIKSENYEYHGEPIAVTFNFKYLKEAIGIYDGKIEMNMDALNSVVMITSPNSNNKQLVCPLRSV